jgi:hypothetical protein
MRSAIFSNPSFYGDAIIFQQIWSWLPSVFRLFYHLQKHSAGTKARPSIKPESGDILAGIPAPTHLTEQSMDDAKALKPRHYHPLGHRSGRTSRSRPSRQLEPQN